MTRRPFTVMPRVTRTPALGWTYLRWGRSLRRIPDDWAEDLLAVFAGAGVLAALTMLGLSLIWP